MSYQKRLADWLLTVGTRTYRLYHQHVLPSNYSYLPLSLCSDHPSPHLTSSLVYVGTGNSLLNSGSEHYQKWTEIPEFYGCTCCGPKEQDSAVLSLEQFTQNVILHVFFEADLLIYIILIDFCKTSHACTIYFQLLSQRKHVL